MAKVTRVGYRGLAMKVIMNFADMTEVVDQIREYHVTFS